MPGTELNDLSSKGLEALALGNTLSALAFFEKAMNIEGSPSVLSHFAFCIAKEWGQIGKAISLCEEALRIEPDNSVHYLNLGRIHLLAHKKNRCAKRLQRRFKS
jgi:tetratricopeptide (TPR) repeat protein